MMTRKILRAKDLEPIVRLGTQNQNLVPSQAQRTTMVKCAMRTSTNTLQEKDRGDRESYSQNMKGVSQSESRQRSNLLWLLTLISVMSVVSSHERGLAFVSPSISRRFASQRNQPFQSPADGSILSKNRRLEQVATTSRRSLWPSRSGDAPRDKEEDEEEFDEDDENLFNLLDNPAFGDSKSRKKGQKPSMVQPIGVDEGDIPEEPPRVKADFKNLFAGMPSMGDILGGSDEGTVEQDSEAFENKGSSESKKARKQFSDDTWFHEERKEIMDNYEAILQGMVEELDEKRKEDPESVPANAEAMIKSVLKQEMDREIEETKERRSQERIVAYEEESRADMESQEISGPPNESVQKLIDESEAEYRQQEANRAEIDEFLRYEQEAFRQAAEEGTGKVSLPESGADLDQWALERLQEMASSRGDEDGEEMVLDILEENVEDLKNRIEKEADRGSIRAETMKEWQMYQSIASRLAETESEKDESDEAIKAREERILDQLQSWKEYVEKEKGIRMDSGLSRGPKLPFEWQELDYEESKRKSRSVEPTEKKSRADVRRQLNRMSIEALESLMEKSDPARREKLQNEIDYLKSTLEANDYLDVEEDEEIDQEEVGPVDISDVFTSYSSDPVKEEPPRMSETLKGIQKDTEQDLPPPATPFFSENEEDEPTKPPPPKTAFFADSEEDDSYQDEAAVGDSKLGSMEEQKLKAMYRKAGVRNPEEQEVIRRQWEEFQQFEKAKRDESGLSDYTDSTSDGKADLKYNVSEVMREDGDFDAEKILSSIGPRPKRRRGGSSGGAKQEESTEDKDPSLRSDVGKEELMDSLYRSVSAVGGGRYKDDPEAKAKQQAAFQEYMQKEKFLRESLDDLEKEASEKAASLDSDVDDEEYAEEVIAALGPRPTPRQTRIIDEGDFSDKGGVLASEGDDDDNDEIVSDSQGGFLGDEAASADDKIAQMPEWLKKEAEEKQGSAGRKRKRFLATDDIEEAFDDDTYEHNMRQLAEYERRRAGQQKQMGIDISDVLGRSAFVSDDYADYKYEDYSKGRQDSGWGSVSFEARKNNLMEYRELDVLEVNSLMDHKDSVYSTGVSQYLPRINRPFKEFGAIFRLEGVLVDITGLQMKAWTEVAEKHGYKPPTIEEARQAAVTRPEVAVKEVFFWTDDFIQCGKVALTHRIAFRKVFDEWMKDAGITSAAVESSVSQGSLALGQEIVEESQPVPDTVTTASEDELVELKYNAWTRTAEAFNRDEPQEDDIFRAMTVSPDIAVRSVFRWSTNHVEIDEIVDFYRRAMQSKDTTDVSQPQSLGSSTGSQEPSAPVLDETGMMELHYQAWTKVAEYYGFEPPLPEEVMAAFVINDPEVTVRDGFGWTADSSTLGDVVGEFQSTLDELLGQPRKSKNAAMEPEKPVSDAGGEEETATQSQPSDDGPSPQEIMEMMVSAWSATAETHGFDTPSLAQIELASDMDPEQAIKRLLGWTQDDIQVQEISSTFETVLEKASEKYVQKYGLSEESTEEAGTEDEGPSSDEVYQAAFDAWTATAEQSGLPLPDTEQVQFALTVGPDDAVINGFGWTSDSTEVSQLVELYREELGKRRAKWKGAVDKPVVAVESTDASDVMFRAIPGSSKWIKSLLAVEMSCGVVSYLDRDQVDVLLEQAGLADLIATDKRVAANSGYPRDNQQLLGAAVRLERRPDHCAVFDSSPYASVAAHDVEMRSVSIIGAYPRYDLLSADTSTSSFEDLTAMNIRRLFGERIYDQPQVDTQQNQPENRREAKTQTFWEDD